jgi:putative sigma-54 modulation protein
MKIQIRDRNVETTEILRAHVERRLGVALGRFGERIVRVVVRFSDTGVDKRCQIDVGLRPRSVRVEDTDADLFAAVDHAVDRISRSVARAIERERAVDEATLPPRTSS